VSRSSPIRPAAAIASPLLPSSSSASWGWPPGIAARFAVEGWTTDDVYGHDHDRLERALAGSDGRVPHLVVAHVEPGEG